nr:MAG TPA: hypothetical protein [Caudoviricetes sp.]
MIQAPWIETPPPSSQSEGISDEELSRELRNLFGMEEEE